MRSHKIMKGETGARLRRRFGLSKFTAKLQSETDPERTKGTEADSYEGGDALQIPNVKPRTESVSTGGKLDARYDLPKQDLRVRLIDESNEALADVDYKLTVGKKVLEGKTNTDGWIEKQVDAGPSWVNLEAGTRTWRLRIGELPRLRMRDDGKAIGLAERLTNLGYGSPPTSHFDEWLEESVRAVQRRLKVEPTGMVSKELLEKVEKLHGA